MDSSSPQPRISRGPLREGSCFSLPRASGGTNLGGVDGGWPLSLVGRGSLVIDYSHLVTEGESSDGCVPSLPAERGKPVSEA